MRLEVRSVKANAYDSAYASALAEHAVHGAMAGLTCVSVAPPLKEVLLKCSSYKLYIVLLYLLEHIYISH